MKSVCYYDEYTDLGTRLQWKGDFLRYITRGEGLDQDCLQDREFRRNHWYLPHLLYVYSLTVCLWGWMSVELRLGRYWMDLEWIVDECWMNIERVLDELGVNVEWLLDDCWMVIE